VCFVCSFARVRCLTFVSFCEELLKYLAKIGGYFSKNRLVRVCVCVSVCVCVCVYVCLSINTTHKIWEIPLNNCEVQQKCKVLT